MLHHYDVACHQIGRNEARKLVIGKVPRLNSEEHTNRRTYDLGFARAWRKMFRSKKAFRVLRVIVEYIRAEEHLTTCLLDEFAHFHGRQARKVIRALAHDGCGSANYHCPLRKGFQPPGFKARISSIKCPLELNVSDILECLQEFPIVRVDALISHDSDFLSWCLR